MSQLDFEFEHGPRGVVAKKYLGKGGTIIIPDYFEGKPVTTISTQFMHGRYDKGRIYHLMLPKQLESIEESAFRSLQNLKSVELPEGLLEIKQMGFDYCNSLKEIIFPASLLEVGPRSFYNCFSLKKVIVKNRRTKISPSAFDSQMDFEEVSGHILPFLVPEKRIHLLTKWITGWESLTEEKQHEINTFLIRYSQFRDDLYLEGNQVVVQFLLENHSTLTLDKLERYLEVSIKKDNTAMTAMLLDYKNKNYRKDIQESFYTNKELVEIGFEFPTLKQFKTKWKCKMGEEGLIVREYIGTSTQEMIPEQLDDGTKIVDLLPLPRGLGSIEELEIRAPITTLRSFADNPTLETIILPDSIKSVEGHSTFDRCSKLKSVNLPDHLTELTDSMFQKCQSLEDIVLPSQLKSMGHHIFSDCTSLEQIVIPDGITKIPECAFQGCLSLKEVILPPNLISIRRFAFVNCHQLSTLTNFRLDIKLVEGPFLFCHNLANKEGFLIRDNILLQYTGNAKNVVISEGVVAIGPYAFYQSRLTSVTLPSTLEKVGENSFRNCNYLETFTPNDSLQKIENSAFHHCKQLLPFHFPDSLEFVGNDVFSDCLKMVDSSGFTIFQNELLMFSKNRYFAEVPEGVEIIRENAFAEGSLIEVRLPSTLQTIERKAFYHCNALKTLTFPEIMNFSLTIEKDAFLLCDNLTKINLPKNVKLESGKLSYYADASPEE